MCADVCVSTPLRVSRVFPPLALFLLFVSFVFSLVCIFLFYLIVSLLFRREGVEEDFRGAGGDEWRGGSGGVTWDHDQNILYELLFSIKEKRHSFPLNISFEI